MKNFDLESKLKSLRVPERGEDFWEAFPAARAGGIARRPAGTARADGTSMPGWLGASPAGAGLPGGRLLPLAKPDAQGDLLRLAARTKENCASRSQQLPDRIRPCSCRMNTACTSSSRTSHESFPASRDDRTGSAWKLPRPRSSKTSSIKPSAPLASDIHLQMARWRRGRFFPPRRPDDSGDEFFRRRCRARVWPDQIPGAIENLSGVHAAGRAH